MEETAAVEEVEESSSRILQMELMGKPEVAAMEEEEVEEQAPELLTFLIML
jgi:hypothetical protein